MPPAAAVFFGRVNILKLLVKYPSNHRGRYLPSPPSNLAVENGESRVEKYGRYDVDLNQDSGEQATLLGYAVTLRDTRIAELLISIDTVELDKAGGAGMPPLYMAAACGNTPVVRLLLQSGRVDVNRVLDVSDSYLYPSTALQVAIDGGHDSTVRALHEGLADLMPKGATDGVTYLHRAALRGQDRVVKAFLEDERVDANFKTEFGHTALSFAVIGMREATIRRICSLLCSPSRYPRYREEHVEQERRQATVGILLADDRVDANCRTRIYDGWAGGYFDDTAGVLLERDTLNKLFSRDQGISEEQLATIRLLLAHDDIGWNQEFFYESLLRKRFCTTTPWDGWLIRPTDLSF